MTSFARIGCVWILLVAVIAGCSSVQLGYGQSERLMRWYVGDFVDFDGAQTRVLAQELADLKAWHCSTQLREYSAWLRDLKREAGPSLTAGQVRARTDDVRDFIRAIAADIAPRASKVISGMTDAQISEIRKNLAKDNVKYRARWVDIEPERYREERADRMVSRLKWWIGALTPEQKKIVAQWSENAAINSTAAFESRLRWQQALLTAIEQRADVSRLEDSIRVLLVEPDTYWTEAMQTQLALNRELTYTLFADVAKIVTTEQKQHLDRKLQSLATDFDKLSCAEQRAAAQP